MIERASSGDSGTIRVHSLAGTTVNGQSAATFPTPRKGVDVDLDGDGSSLTFSNLRIQSRLSIHLGGRGNTLLLRKLRVTGSLQVQGGSGIDRIHARDVVVQRDFTGSGGHEKDALSLRRTSIADNFTWLDRSGASRIDLERVEVGRDVDIRLSNSSDRLSILDSGFGQSTELHTFGSDDQIDIHGTTFAENPAIHDGAGEDTVKRELYFKWDFAGGEQGWSGEFSDHGSKSSPDQDLPFTFAADKGIAAIRDDGPLDGKVGYRFAATNISDDLFMSLSRKLGREAGVEAATLYRAEFEVEFASETSAGLGGIGGPPAESVIMKAGGVGYEPVGFDDEITGRWILNIKKANQSASSPDSDLTNLGNIANGSVDVLQDVFRPVVHRGEHIKPIAASADGNLWLIVGTDSGFEGRTTLYYLSIAVRLTPLGDS